MSQVVYELLIFGGLVAALSLVAGLLLRRWWLSSLLAAALAGLIVPLYAVAENGWRARPSDVAFWLPMMALYSAALAAPVAFAIGFILYLVRKRKARV